jgi:hypothetical protein
MHSFLAPSAPKFAHSIPRRPRIRSIASGVNVILLITQIALGVIIGDFTIALLVTGFLVWNSRQRNERLAVRLFIAGAVIVVVLVVVS